MIQTNISQPSIRKHHHHFSKYNNLKQKYHINQSNNREEQLIEALKVKDEMIMKNYMDQNEIMKQMQTGFIPDILQQFLILVLVSFILSAVSYNLLFENYKIGIEEGDKFHKLNTSMLSKRETSKHTMLTYWFIENISVFLPFLISKTSIHMSSEGLHYSNNDQGENKEKTYNSNIQKDFKMQLEQKYERTNSNNGESIFKDTSNYAELYSWIAIPSMSQMVIIEINLLFFACLLHQLVFKENATQNILANIDINAYAILCQRIMKMVNQITNWNIILMGYFITKISFREKDYILDKFNKTDHIQELKPENEEKFREFVKKKRFDHQRNIKEHKDERWQEQRYYPNKAKVKSSYRKNQERNRKQKPTTVSAMPEFLGKRKQRYKKENFTFKGKQQKKKRTFNSII